MHQITRGRGTTASACSATRKVRSVVPFRQRLRIVSDQCWEAQPGRPYRKLTFRHQGISKLGPEDNFLEDPRGQDAHAVFRYTEIPLIFCLPESSGSQSPRGKEASSHGGRRHGPCRLYLRRPCLQVTPLAQDSRGRHKSMFSLGGGGPLWCSKACGGLRWESKQFVQLPQTHDLWSSQKEKHCLHATGDWEDFTRIVGPQAFSCPPWSAAFRDSFEIHATQP